MDKDGSLKINWHEWRDYLILSSGIKDLKDILHYWRHATVSTKGHLMVVGFITTYAFSAYHH
jgi:hypothetical protein